VRGPDPVELSGAYEKKVDEIRVFVESGTNPINLDGFRSRQLVNRGRFDQNFTKAFFVKIFYFFLSSSTPHSNAF
jgi:hypothetical protein